MPTSRGPDTPEAAAHERLAGRPARSRGCFDAGQQIRTRSQQRSPRRRRRGNAGCDAGGTHALAAGYVHSLAATGDGSAWGWGGNGACQLGDGTTTPRCAPVPLEGLDAEP